MGMLDDIKMVSGLVKDGTRAVKISMKLDELTSKAITDFENVLTPRQKEMYQNYTMLKDKQEHAANSRDVSDEEKNALVSQEEGAQIYFLSSVSRNARVPQAFKEELKVSIAEYKEANAHLMDAFKERLLKLAKTDEERRQAQAVIAEMESKE